MAWACAKNEDLKMAFALAPIAIGVLITFFVKEKSNWSVRQSLTAKYHNLDKLKLNPNLP